MKEIVDNNELERWTFGINTNQLVELVLEGKKTATTYLYEDDNSIIGLKDTSSFDVLSGYSLLCHYNDNIIKTENNINYLKKYSIGRRVIYLPEEDTIFIDSNDIELIGDKEYIVFNNGNMQVISPLDDSFILNE